MVLGSTLIVARDCRIRRNYCKGYGTQARWIRMEGASTFVRPAVVCLIEEAIARNRVPFAHTGRGPVIIRSVSAKKRQRRPA